MDKVHVIKLRDGQTIEIGPASWDAAQVSVKNRYPAGNNGTTGPSSAEVPLEDVPSLLRAIADRDLLEPWRITRLIEALVDSLARRAGVKRPSFVQLMDGMTPENVHEEIETGPPVGKEVW